MNDIKKVEICDKDTFYDNVNLQLRGLIEEEPDWLANVSNAASLLYLQLENINWAGFYFYKKGELVLGPFQGKPACTHITVGKGVCGRAAEERKTVIVADVHQFPGHIACDSASQSEIVIPIVKANRLIGVLDIDSPVKGRFDEEDGLYLQHFVDILNQYIEWPEMG